MDIVSYKKAVFKTLSIKPAKEGLRKVARKTPNTNIAHAIVGLKSETGELLQGLQPYILGVQLNATMRSNAQEELGDIAYYTTVLCRTLHVKMPSATKKVLLKGTTLTKAILELDSIATNLLDQYKKAFYGRDLDMALITKLTEPVPALLYAICFTLFQQPVSVVMDGNIAKLTARYPQGFFDNIDQHNRNKVDELEKMAGAVQASTVQNVDAAATAKNGKAAKTAQTA